MHCTEQKIVLDTVAGLFEKKGKYGETSRLPNDSFSIALDSRLCVNNSTVMHELLHVHNYCNGFPHLKWNNSQNNRVLNAQNRINKFVLVPLTHVSVDRGMLNRGVDSFSIEGNSISQTVEDLQQIDSSRMPMRLGVAVALRYHLELVTYESLSRLKNLYHKKGWANYFLEAEFLRSQLNENMLSGEEFLISLKQVVNEVYGHEFEFSYTYKPIVNQSGRTVYEASLILESRD